MATLDTFNYDESLTFDQNFTSWYQMNSAERRVFNEEIYTVTEGFKVFSTMYADNKERQI
jgi:hypothetical protein